MKATFLRDRPRQIKSDANHRHRKRCTSQFSSSWTRNVHYVCLPHPKRVARVEETYLQSAPLLIDLYHAANTAIEFLMRLQAAQLHVATGTCADVAPLRRHLRMRSQRGGRRSHS